MATYIELKQKAEKLMAEAEQMRLDEMANVVADIKEKMQAYGLTLQDLGGSAGKRKSSGGGKSKSAGGGSAGGSTVVKFRGPNGETWSGGRGRKPQWVADVVKSGKKIEEFAV